MAVAAVPLSPPAMADVRLRVPMKAGYFTVPDDPATAPEVICSRCQDCGEYFFPQRLVCAKCQSRRTVEAKVPARGTLYSFTFVHMRFDRAWTSSACLRRSSKLITK